MKKNLFKKSLLSLIPLAITAVPLASCANHNSVNNIGSSNQNSSGWTPPIDSGNNANTESHIGEIDKRITDDISQSVKLDVLDLSTKTGVNNYQSVSNFLNYNLDKGYNNKLITENGIRSDVYSFVDKIFKNNRGIFSIDLKDDPVIKVDQVNTRSLESDKAISLNLQLVVTNESDREQPFKLLSDSYNLQPHAKYILAISFDNQIPSYLINSINNRYFLGIRFDKVNFKLTDSNANNLGDFSLDKFTFTPDQFSYNFKKEFLYLSDESDYNDVLNNKSVADILNSKTDDDFKKDLQDEFIKTQNNYMQLVSVVNNLFKSLSDNDSLEVFLSKNTVSIITVLSQFGLINLGNNIQGLITDLLNKDKSIVQAIQDNKNALIDIVKSVVGNNQLIVSIAQNIVDSIKPELTKEEQEKVVEQIKSLFSFIGDSTNKYLFVVDLVKNMLSGQNIYDFVKEALKKNEVKDLINGLPSNIKPIVSLLSEIIEKDETSKSLIDIIFDNKDKIIVLVDSLVQNNTVKKIIDIAIKNNKNFTKENMKALITKTLYGLTNGIVNNFDKPVSNFKEFKFDKTKKEFTFEFNSIYKVNKEFRWELKPLIDLLPDDFNLQSFGLDTNEIEKKVQSAASGFINLNKDKGKEWYIFKKTDILGFFPTYIDFKVGDSLEFVNRASNQQIWLNPQRVGSKQFFGYSVPTVSGFRLNLPGGVESIFAQYKNNDNGIDFTKMFAEFLTQEHDYYQKVSVLNNNKEITDDLVYDNDLYINNVPFNWNITINKAFKEKVKSHSKRKVLDTYKVKTSDQIEVAINSYELTNKLTQEELGAELIKDYDKLFKNKQYKPFIMLDQISNFDDRTLVVPLSVKILGFFSRYENIDLKLWNYTFTVSAYLPFKTYNSNHQFTDYLKSQTGTYLKAGVKYSRFINETFYNDWIV